MASITSVGTGSGLDLENLLTKILDAEETPVTTRLNAREAKVQGSISAIGTLKSTLADFQSSLTKLKTTTQFATRTATASDTSLFSATATSGAELGSHAINVVQMAKTQKLASANFASPTATVGSGTLSINVGGSNFNVDITAGSNDSVAGIRDAINNAAGNTGVRASLLTVSDGAGGTATKLVLTSTKSGSDGAISVAVTDADGNATDNAGLSQLRYDATDPAFDPADPAFESGRVTASSPAQDAIITVDGFESRSSSNVFAATIPGITLTLLKESSDPAEPLAGTLSVAEDKTGIKTAISSFVANYNALVGVISQLTSADSSKAGLLAGDNSIRLVQSRLRSILGSTVEGAASGMSSLAALGLSTARDGTITLDSDKVDAALASNYDGLTTLFSGSNGIAGKLDTAITALTGSDGVFATRLDSLNEQLDNIDQQREQLSTRMTQMEARYRAKFSALDSLVTQLNQTSSFLTEQLAATKASKD